MTTQCKPFRFTNTAIDELPLEKGQIIYKDTQLAHLGILVGLRTKSFFVQASHQGRSIRHNIGKFPYMSVEEARKKATAALAKIFRGENPNTQRKVERDLMKLTLSDAWAHYKRTRTGMKQKTISDYEGTLKRYFRDWQKRPLIDITPQMVLKRHAQLGSNYSHATANGSIRVFRAVYNFARAVQPGLPNNPVGVLSQTRGWFKDKRRTRVIEARDLRSWWQATEELSNPDFRDYLQFTLLTGLRKTEGLRLTWCDVDESPRLYRRLHTLRVWSNEYIKKIFPGGAGTGRTHGAGTAKGPQFTVGRNPVDRIQDRLYV